MTDGLNLADESVLVIPCSGIGKAMGTISREGLLPNVGLGPGRVTGNG